MRRFITGYVSSCSVLKASLGSVETITKNAPEIAERLHPKGLGGTIRPIDNMDNTTQIASHLLRSRIGKICVAITGATPDEMVGEGL